MGRQDNYAQLFISLSEAVDNFLSEARRQNMHNMATESWTVKDVLRHIAFWHDYYARNYSSFAQDSKPYVFTSKGGSKRNQDGVDSLRHKSQKDLIKLITEAQASLYESIVIQKVPRMNYTDRKTYKTEEFLEEIMKHIGRHTAQIRRSKEPIDDSWHES